MREQSSKVTSPGDQEIIAQITHLAGIAIERKLTQNKLQRSNSGRGAIFHLSLPMIAP